MDWILTVEIVTHISETETEAQRREMLQRTRVNVQRAVSQVLGIPIRSRVYVKDNTYRINENGFRFDNEDQGGMRIRVEIDAHENGMGWDNRRKLTDYLRTPDVLNVLAGILRSVDVPWNARMEKAVSAAYASFTNVPEFVPSESNPKLQRMRPENQNRRDLNEEVRWGWAGGQGYRELAGRTEVGR